MQRFSFVTLSLGLAMSAVLAACSSDGAGSDGVGGTGGTSGAATSGGDGGGSGTGGATGMGGANSSGTGGATTTSGAGGTSGTSGTSGTGGAGGVGGATTTGGGGAGGNGAGGGGGGALGTGGAAGGPNAPVPSAGCGTPLPGNQEFETWVEQPMLDVEGDMRRWWVWLPETYDEERAYPVVVLLHGCGNESNNVPVQNQSDQDAILIRGRAMGAEPACWNTQQNGPDIPFFDAMLEATENAFCADTSRVFAAGYSSGSHLINALACYRGDTLRAAGTVSGGSPSRTNCTGAVARMFIFDVNDMEPGNSITQTAGERDRLLEMNGCDSVDPMPFDPAPGLAMPTRTCTRYQGCDDNPIIWCETEEQQHGRQDNFASQAYWNLFSEL